MKAFPTYRYFGKNYSIPYWLPPGKRGDWSVSVEWKKAGTKLPVVSMRNAIFMGLPPTSVFLDSPLGIHNLVQGGSRWMTTLPQEVEQISRQVSRLKGRVLVGGLGLGLANAYLEANDAVTEIVVVEKSPEVIALIKPCMPKEKTIVVEGDLFEYLKDLSLCHFDFAFYDIWCPTGERVLTQHVMPLRRLSRNIVAQENIECWNEEEMLGQIKMHVQTACQSIDWKESPIHGLLKMPEQEFNRFKSGQGFVWYFYRWMRQEKPTTEQGLARVEEFIASLKDPKKFDEEWA